MKKDLELELELNEEETNDKIYNDPENKAIREKNFSKLFEEDEKTSAGLDKLFS